MESIVPRPPGRIVTHTDYVHLTRLLREGGPELPGATEVQRALRESALLASSSVAPGVVTMGAQVFLVCGADEPPSQVTLVYPQHADDARGRISVLSPLGASLFGLSVGETVSWRALGRVHSARILSVLAKHANARGVVA